MASLDEVVIVGAFDPDGREEEKAMYERMLLMRNLTILGVNQRRVNEMWPRDCFVFHNDKIYRQSQHGNYADGGFLYVFSNLLVCCSEVSELDSRYKRSLSSIAQRTLRLWRLYRERPEIMPPPNLDLNKELRPHIDMVMLPIPQKKVVFFDEDYFLAHEDEARKFCLKRGFRLELVCDDYDNPSWPCNSLVLETEKGTTAIVNSESDGRFIYSLEKYGIKVLGVAFSANCKMGGGIHCATNIVPMPYIYDALDVFGGSAIMSDFKNI